MLLIKLLVLQLPTARHTESTHCDGGNNGAAPARALAGRTAEAVRQLTDSSVAAPALRALSRRFSWAADRTRTDWQGDID